MIKTYTMQRSFMNDAWENIEIFKHYPLTYISGAIAYAEETNINIPVRYRAICDQTGEIVSTSPWDAENK